MKTEEDVEVEDQMRFMNGGNLAVNFECGDQHGGHYGCPGCDGHLSMCHHLKLHGPKKEQNIDRTPTTCVSRNKRKRGKATLETI